MLDRQSHPHTGVLLVNLGTPTSQEPTAVKEYLTEFLTDERVIDLPFWKRQLLVRGVIIPRRLLSTTHSYQKIWKEEGSPLLHHGKRVLSLLQKELGDGYLVKLGMRYQQPSLEKVIKEFLEKKLERLLILPLFPQYSSATTGSIHQKIMELLHRELYLPQLIFISQYATHPALIEAFAAVAADVEITSYDAHLFSFHGLPERHIKKLQWGENCLKEGYSCCEPFNCENHFCYVAQCRAMAYALMDKLNLPRDRSTITFQSRLGKEPWLRPYTQESIEALAHQGAKRVLVFTPSFICDCLETLYEIGVEGKEAFQSLGGQDLHLVPGLNEHPAWIRALKRIVYESVGEGECARS